MNGCHDRGFSLVELAISMAVLGIALVATASLFSTGYGDVVSGGTTTMAAAAARQILEDVRAVPFDNLLDLNQFDSNSVGSLPPLPDEDTLNPAGRIMARNTARKWRYALAGDGVGWGFTTAEKNQWSRLLTQGINFGGRGQITVESPAALLRRVTITITPPGRGPTLQMATLISRL